MTDRPRLAFVAHAWPPGSLGGVEVASSALAAALALEVPVRVFVRDASPGGVPGRVRHRREGDVAVTTVELPAGRLPFPRTWADPRAEGPFRDFLADARPDWVVFAHLMGLSAALPALARAAGARVAFVLHDYWYLCARGQLVDARGLRCLGPAGPRCTRCLADALAVPEGVPGPLGTLFDRVRAVPGAAGLARVGLGALAGARDAEAVAPAIAERERTFRELLSGADLLLAPSRHIADRYVRWGVPPDLPVVFPNAVPSPPPATRPAAPGHLRIGYLGQLIPTKGVEVLLAAFHRMPRRGATLAVRGPFVPYPLDPGFERRVRRAAGRCGADLGGPLDPSAVPAFLTSLDALCVPSTWEENAPLVVGEARRAGVAVVASALGGLGEQVRHGVDGLLVAPGDPEALAGALARLAERPEDARLLGARGVAPPSPRSVAEALLARLRGVDTGDPLPLASP